MRIEYICFTSYSGFAYSAKNNIKALKSVGYDISVNPLDLGFNKSINKRDYSFFKSLVDSRVGDIQVYHCIPIMQRRVPYSGKVIGYGTFENSEVPIEWINILSKNDIVIAPSRFNEASFSSVLDNVFYLPHCLDFSEYSFNIQKESSPYRFLFFGTWKNRKNYKTLIRAFIEEFSGQKDVELILKTRETSHNHPKKSIFRIQQQLKREANIHIDSSILKDEDLPQYFSQFNCFVCPTLGEGFGLPGLQAMASGLPVIITNYSGCTDYANSETALLLEVEGFEKLKDVDGIIQFRNKFWPKITLKELRQKMRFAYENQKYMQDLARNAYSFVKNKFNYKTIISKFEKLIKI